MTKFIHYFWNLIIFFLCLLNHGPNTNISQKISICKYIFFIKNPSALFFFVFNIKSKHMYIDFVLWFHCFFFLFISNAFRKGLIITLVDILHLERIIQVKFRYFVFILMTQAHKLSIFFFTNHTKIRSLKKPFHC